MKKQRLSNFDKFSDFRFEFKYCIDDTLARLISKDIQRYGVVLDPYSATGEGGSYYVSSLYFDTPHLEDFHDKMGGFLERRKIRARIYGKGIGDATDCIWLEQKYKRDMALRKDRIRLTSGEWKQFLSGGALGLLAKAENAGQKEIIWHLLKQSRCPSVFVGYRREPYVYKFYGQKEVRITFDANIEARGPCFGDSLGYTDFMFPVLPHKVIMEVKFNRILPWWFADIVRRYNLSRGAFSKYSLSLDAIKRRNIMPR